MVPQGLIERVPCRLEEFERLLEVRPEFSGRSPRAGLRGQVWVISGRVESADLADRGTAEEQNMGLGFVGEVHDDVPP